MTGMTKVVGFDGSAEGASDGDGECDADAPRGGPPTLPRPGPIMEAATPAMVNTTAAAAAMPIHASRSTGNGRRAQEDRRDCRVVRTSTAIARRVDSGSSYGPSSSQAA